MDEWEDWEGRGTGSRAKVAGIVLAVVFLSVPLLSFAFALAGHRELGGGVGIPLVALAVGAVIAGLYLCVRLLLRRRMGSAHRDDDLW